MYFEHRKIVISCSFAVFFSISSFSEFLDGFGMILLWISIPWRDFLPGGGPKSLWDWIFTQNDNFINNE